MPTQENSEQQFLSGWQQLSERERAHLLPRLLQGMRGWQVWSSEPESLMMWLSHTFEKAEIPFRRTAPDDNPAISPGNGAGR